MRALLAAIWICFGAAAALGEPYSINGQVGYLQEWEFAASLAKMASGRKMEFSGPMTLRHVGLCSTNGAEEKSGEMRITISQPTGAIEGTIALAGDSCRIVATRLTSYSGLLICRDAQGIPIHFSINPMRAADQNRADGR
jgi:hypothetical protein